MRMRKRGMQQLSLNQTQKLRVDRAFEKLQSFSSKLNSNAFVTLADTIVAANDADNGQHGHGTRKLEDDSVVATVCGIVDHVDKLVRVLPMRASYEPQTGDIVVGRVIEVASNFWRLEINSSQCAVLKLSSMNLPDGIQRRRTALDELNMRSIFKENDVICAEVQAKRDDGALLQARSQKYGKLEKGQMLTVPPYLVKRRKQHFHHLDQYGIDLILGCNGFIWVGEHVNTKDPTEEDHTNKSEYEQVMTTRTYSPAEIRQNICRMANAVRVSYTLGFSITVELLSEIVNLSTALNLDMPEMLESEFCVLVAEGEAERRSVMSKRRK